MSLFMSHNSFITFFRHYETQEGTSMALVGYARVSSVGQSLDVQQDKLKHCDKIYEEKKSGATAPGGLRDRAWRRVWNMCARAIRWW